MWYTFSVSRIVFNLPYKNLVQQLMCSSPLHSHLHELLDQEHRHRVMPAKLEFLHWPHNMEPLSMPRWFFCSACHLGTDAPCTGHGTCRQSTQFRQKSLYLSWKTCYAYFIHQFCAGTDCRHRPVVIHTNRCHNEICFSRYTNRFSLFFPTECRTPNRLGNM